MEETPPQPQQSSGHEEIVVNDPHTASNQMVQILDASGRPTGRWQPTKAYLKGTIHEANKIALQSAPDRQATPQPSPQPIGSYDTVAGGTSELPMAPDPLMSGVGGTAMKHGGVQAAEEIQDIDFIDGLKVVKAAVAGLAIGVLAAAELGINVGANILKEWRAIRKERREDTEWQDFKNFNKDNPPIPGIKPDELEALMKMALEKPFDFRIQVGRLSADVQPKVVVAAARNAALVSSQNVGARGAFNAAFDPKIRADARRSISSPRVAEEYDEEDDQRPSMIEQEQNVEKYDERDDQFPSMHDGIRMEQEQNDDTIPPVRAQSPNIANQADPEYWNEELLEHGTNAPDEDEDAKKIYQRAYDDSLNIAVLMAQRDSGARPISQNMDPSSFLDQDEELFTDLKLYAKLLGAADDDSAIAKVSKDFNRLLQKHLANRDAHNEGMANTSRPAIEEAGTGTADNQPHDSSDWPADKSWYRKVEDKQNPTGGHQATDPRDSKRRGPGRF